MRRQADGTAPSNPFRSAKLPAAQGVYSSSIFTLLGRRGRSDAAPVVEIPIGHPSANVVEGRLREDLYYHLNVFTVELPALRDRLDDLAPLVEHSIEDFNREHNKTVQGLGEDCLDALRSHT